VTHFHFFLLLTSLYTDVKANDMLAIQSTRTINDNTPIDTNDVKLLKISIIFVRAAIFLPYIFHKFYRHYYAIILSITYLIVAIKHKPCILKVWAHLVKYLMRLKKIGFSTQIC